MPFRHLYKVKRPPTITIDDEGVTVAVVMGDDTFRFEIAEPKFLKFCQDSIEAIHDHELRKQMAEDGLVVPFRKPG